MKKFFIFIWLILVVVGLIGCSTTITDTNLNEKDNLNEWEKRLEECRAFMYMENDAWHWCMETKKERAMQQEEIRELSKEEYEIFKEFVEKNYTELYEHKLTYDVKHKKETDTFIVELNHLDVFTWEEFFDKAI
tara:strand:+ start:35 stop:436 length:402 start_codon:yes stop_codon:yes gene_type:complete